MRTTVRFVLRNLLLTPLYVCCGFVAQAATLTVWAPQLGAGVPEKEIWQPLIEEFEKTHPGIKVDIQFPEIGPESYTVALAAGTAPDVGYFWNEMLPTFVHAGALLPIDRFVRPSERADFYDLKYTRYNGNLWGIPLFAGGRVLFYNRGLLNAAGVAAPDTWEDFRDVAGRTTRDPNGDGKPDVWGFKIPVDAKSKRLTLNHGWTPWFEQAGGTWFTPDGRRTLINSPEGREALTFLYRLAHEDHSASLGAGSLSSGTVAMEYGSVTWAGSLAKTMPELELGMVPAVMHRRRVSWFAQDFWVMFAHTKVAQAAYDWMVFTASGKGKRHLHKYIAELPVSRSEGNPRPDDPVFRQILQSMDVLKGRPIVLEGQRIYHEVMAEFLGRAVLGEIPVNQALEQTERQVNLILSEAWARVEQKR